MRFGNFIEFIGDSADFGMDLAACTELIEKVEKYCSSRDSSSLVGTITLLLAGELS